MATTPTPNADHLHVVHPAPCPQCLSLDGFVYSDDSSDPHITLYCHACRVKWRRAFHVYLADSWARIMPEERAAIVTEIGSYMDVTQELHDKMATGWRFPEGEWQISVWPGKQRPAVCPECSGCDELILYGVNDYGACREHGTRWFIGARTGFSNWRGLKTEDHDRSEETLSRLRSAAGCRCAISELYRALQRASNLREHSQERHPAIPADLKTLPKMIPGELVRPDISTDSEHRYVGIIPPETVMAGEQYHDKSPWPAHRGLCPTCGDEGIIFELGHQEWRVCEACSVRWHNRNRLHEVDHETWASNRKVLAEYKIAKPRSMDRFYGMTEIGKTDEGGTIFIPTSVNRAKPVHRYGRDGVPFRFDHGLGDCVCLAYQIPVYAKRGHKIRIACRPDKAWLFKLAGAEVVTDAPDKHAWTYPPTPDREPENWLPYNKLWHNVGAWPLPGIERESTVWEEYLGVQLEVKESVQVWKRPSHRPGDEYPLVVVHPEGMPPIDRRSLPIALRNELYIELVRRANATVVVLDYPAFGKTEPTPIPAGVHGLYSMHREWGNLTLPQLHSLLSSADLFIGCDSGPAHFIRLTDTPAVVCWTQQVGPFGCPAFCALPRKKTTNIVPSSAGWRAKLGAETFNIIECPRGENALDADFIVDIAMSAMRNEAR